MYAQSHTHHTQKGDEVQIDIMSQSKPPAQETKGPTAQEKEKLKWPSKPLYSESEKDVLDDLEKGIFGEMAKAQVANIKPEFAKNNKTLA